MLQIRGGRLGRFMKVDLGFYETSRKTMGYYLMEKRDLKRQKCPSREGHMEKLTEKVDGIWFGVSVRTYSALNDK